MLKDKVLEKNPPKPPVKSIETFENTLQGKLEVPTQSISKSKRATATCDVEQMANRTSSFA